MKTQPILSQSSGRERVPTGAPSLDWEALFKQYGKEIDPLEIWEQNFNGWVRGVQRFRQLEKEIFFADTDNVENKRMHRGYLCSLISSGDFLVAMLHTSPLKPREKKEKTAQVDAFLSNLMVTFETWHSLHTPQDKENPLHEFAA
jgi:hypothetical protein